MTITVSEYEQRFPALANLMSYLNLDWKKIFHWEGAKPSFEAVVRHFKATNSKRQTEEAIQDLKQLLAMPLDEEQLRDATEQMKAAYYPPSNGQTYRKWLEVVLGVLQEPTEQAHKLRLIESTDTGEWKQYVDEETKQMLNIQ